MSIAPTTDLPTDLPIGLPADLPAGLSDGLSNGTDAGLPTDDFARVADPHRRELLVHCYRILGSIQDAEDLVQETMLRAWQAYPRFEGRSSVRVWLYKIATNACLRALQQRRRLPLPSGLGAATQDPTPTEMARTTDLWIEPIPTALLDDAPGADPAEIAGRRESVRLAFIGALHLLPARQRAALVLREVLQFSAQESAEILDMTPQAVASALQRARKQLATVRLSEHDVVQLPEPAVRDLLDRYVRAFESADVTALLELFREDIILEMPPIALWLTGREAVGRFLARQLEACAAFRLVPAEANGQPAFGVYQREPDRVWRARSIHVLDITATGITRLTSFLDPSLFGIFGLAPALPRGN